MTNQDEIIKSVAKQDEGQNDKVEDFLQLVVFNLDNEEHAVEIKDLQEIIKLPDITPIPGTPDFIRGIFNLRGKIIVVLDLEKKFGLIRQTKNKEGNIIITEVGGSSFGVIVDKVTEIINVPLSAIQQTPALSTSKIETDYLKGVVVIEKKDKNVDNDESVEKESTKIDSRLIILLDLPKMLQEKELLKLSEKVK